MKCEELFFLSSFISITNALSLSQDPSTACTILPRSTCPSKLRVVGGLGDKSVLPACLAEVVIISDVEGPINMDGEMSGLLAVDELGTLAGDSEPGSCILESTLLWKSYGLLLFFVLIVISYFVFL